MTFAASDGFSHDPAMLKILNISASFGGMNVLDAVSFSVCSGEIVALIGPNGAGKTTLFNIITGHIDASQGDVILDGESLIGLAPHSIATRGIRRTFQSVRVFNRLTVVDNLLVSSRMCANGICWQVLVKPNQYDTAALRDADNALEFIGLQKDAKQPAENLSYGQKKLLALGMCLMQDCKILLLDEPLAGVQPDIASRILTRLREIRNADKAVLFIEHDIEAVIALADRVVVLDGGRKIAEGAASVVQHNPIVSEAYLT